MRDEAKIKNLALLEMKEYYVWRKNYWSLSILHVNIRKHHWAVAQNRLLKYNKIYLLKNCALILLASCFQVFWVLLAFSQVILYNKCIKVDNKTTYNFEMSGKDINYVRYVRQLFKCNGKPKLWEELKI